MFNPFGQLGELKKMRDQAMQIQKELEKEEVSVDKHGVEVVMTGDQKIKELKSNGKDDNNIKDAINEAIKESQKIAAKRLASMQGGLGGLLGGGS